MTISRIKSRTIRRTVIIVTAIPMLAAILVLGVLEGMCRAAGEAELAIRNAWRGR
jgi:choline-glycine betaine transporter